MTKNPNPGLFYLFIFIYFFAGGGGRGWVVWGGGEGVSGAMNMRAAIFCIHDTLSRPLLQFHENNPDGIQNR